MRHILYFTPEEQEAFAAHSDELKEGWEIEQETSTFADTPEKMNVRLHLLHIDDPMMHVFVETAEQAKSVDELASLILDTNLSDVSERDLAKIFFAMGPEPLRRIVPALIAAAKTDEDIQAIADITTVRHMVLSSLTHTAAL